MALSCSVRSSPRAMIASMSSSSSSPPFELKTASAPEEGVRGERQRIAPNCAPIAPELRQNCARIARSTEADHAEHLLLRQRLRLLDEAGGGGEASERRGRVRAEECGELWAAPWGGRRACSTRRPCWITAASRYLQATERGEEEEAWAVRCPLLCGSETRPVQLPLRALDDHLLDGPARHEAVHVHLPRGRGGVVRHGREAW